LRLLADENVQRELVQGLRQAGHDVSVIGGEQASSPDEDVLALATVERRVLITYDRDFGSLLVREGQRAPAGVVYLRLSRLAIDQTLARLLAVFEQDVTGALVVIGAGKDRKRPILTEGGFENG